MGSEPDPDPIREHLEGLRELLRSLELAPEGHASNLSALRKILGLHGVPLIAADETGRLTEWNSAARELLGWSAEEVLGTNADRFVAEADRARVLGSFAEFLGSLDDFGRSWTEVPIEAIAKDGRRIPLAATYSASRSSRGWTFSAVLRRRIESEK